MESFGVHYVAVDKTSQNAHQYAMVRCSELIGEAENEKIALLDVAQNLRDGNNPLQDHERRMARLLQKPHRVRRLAESEGMSQEDLEVHIQHSGTYARLLTQPEVEHSTAALLEGMQRFYQKKCSRTARRSRAGKRSPQEHDKECTECMEQVMHYAQWKELPELMKHSKEVLAVLKRLSEHTRSLSIMLLSDATSRAALEEPLKRHGIHPHEEGISPKKRRRRKIFAFYSVLEMQKIFDARMTSTNE